MFANSRPTVWICLLVAVAGCSDLGAPLEPRPHPDLSAVQLDFGTVAVTQSITREFTLTNDGTGILSGLVTIACAEFTIDSGAGPFSLPAGGSRTVVIRFTPAAVGNYTCVVELGAQVGPVHLVGVGALQNPGARGVVLQDSISFGTVAVGRTASANFEVLSAGTASLLVNIVSSCSEFEITSGGGEAEIPAGSSRFVTVVFRPSAGGRSSCEIALGPACPTVKVAGLATSVSFQTDLQPILTSRCGSCHEFGMPQFYDTYATLVTDYASYPQGRIKPYDLENSWLYQKLLGNPVYGARMPQGSNLPDAQIDLFRRWIEEGALDN